MIIVVALVIFIPLTGYLILRTSRVQTALVGYMSHRITEATGCDVTIGAVDIAWFLDLVVEDLLIKDTQDSIMCSLPLLQIDLHDIYRKQKRIEIDGVSLDGAKINLRVYAADSTLNLIHLINYFNSGNTDTVQKNNSWTFSLNELILRNTSFIYHDELADHEDVGMDYMGLDIQNIQAHISDIHLGGDTIIAQIENLAAKEKCGFDLKKLSGQIVIAEGIYALNNAKIETNNSILDADYTMLYHQHEDFLNYVDSVVMEVKVRPSIVMMEDIAFFAPPMLGMQDTLYIEGDVRGPVRRLKAKTLSVKYGKSTRFIGSVRMDGLPDIRSTFFHLNIKEFIANTADLEHFKLPGGENIMLPAQLRACGNIDVDASFTGFYNDFVSYGSFITDLGKASMDLSIRNNMKTGYLGIKGSVKTERFDVGTLAEVNDLGSLSMDVDVSGGVWNHDSIYLEMVGGIDSLEFRQNSYDRIDIHGMLAKEKFSGFVTVEDELVQLDFSGLIDFGRKQPLFQFTSNITDCEPGRMNLLKDAGNDSFSTSLKIDFSGNNVDDVKGKAEIINTLYRHQGEEYVMDYLGISTQPDSLGKKTLHLTSDFIDASINGYYSFATIGQAIVHQLLHYMPALKNDSLLTAGHYSDENKNAQQFDYRILLKDLHTPLLLAAPGWNLPQGALIEGSYNSSLSEAIIHGTAKELTYNNIVFNNWFVNGYTHDSLVKIETGLKKIVLKKPDDSSPYTIGLDSLRIISSLKNNVVEYAFLWNDFGNRDRNIGKISGKADFSSFPYYRISLDSTQFIINDSTWSIGADNSILADSSGLHFNNIYLGTSYQALNVNGSISNRPGKSLDIRFSDLNLSNADILLGSDMLDFDGIINGELRMLDLKQDPNFIADLTISDFYFSGQYLGNLMLKSNWDAPEKALQVLANISYQGNKGMIYPLTVKGKYFPEAKKDQFDFGIDIKNLKLKVLTPFLNAFLSDINGYASGNLHLGGLATAPELTGSVKTMRSQVKVDFLNVRYSFADQIFLDKDAIRFDNLMVYDSLGNKAALDGRVFHTGFQDWGVDLHISTDRIAGINTTQAHNSLFYGRAVGKGDVYFQGPVSDMLLKIDVSNDKGTQMTIPLNLDGELTRSDFVRFRSNQTHHEKTQTTDYFKQPEGMTIDMNLDVNPDASVTLFLPEDMGRISCHGEGNVRLKMTPSGDMEMFGDYKVRDGSFILTWENMLYKKLKLQSGGYIEWLGDPYTAKVDISAAYPLRASLAGLESFAGDPNYAEQRIPVEAIIHLKNNLFNPDISFGIQLPGSDPEIKSRVFSAIDTTNEVAMTQQVISLLVLNSFSSPNSNLASGVGTSSFEVLSNQLSNWLSQISNDFDIGVNYRPGDQISPQEFEVALRTQLFNNRVTIDGNLGVSGNNQNSTSTENANDIVGDVNIDVKLTRDGRFRVKAFNRSNQYNPLEYYSDYTQGVGIFFHKEFNSFKEIFKKREIKPPLAPPR